MVDVWFYHLERRRLDDVLPELLTRTLQRDWRAVVRCGVRDRLEAIDKNLWTFNEESFLPHGREGDPQPDQHPIWITSGIELPNNPQCLFLVEGAEAPQVGGLERVIDLFDGNDPDAVSAARQRFKGAKDAGHNVTYWQQEESGKWVQKA